MLRSLRHFYISLIIVVSGVALCGCPSNVWNELPDNISSFIARYYPGQGVSDYTVTDDGSRVEMSNGAILVFDSKDNWTTIDGNGSRLPEVLAYDQLPPALFQYLKETGNADASYKIERTSSTYIITLEDTYITYDVDSSTVTYPTAPQASSKNAGGS